MRLIPADELRTLYAKSDRQGIVRTLAHLALLAGVGALVAYARGRWWLPLALILDGLVIVSLFAVMHECVHGSAFRTRWLNDLLGWLAGVAILYNATYYRQFHFAHHRYTQDPERDPELLTTPPPRSRAQYWLRASALPYWRLRLANLVDHARGRFDRFAFVPAAARAEVVRSARLVLALLVAAGLASVALGSAAVLWYWLLPLALGLPFLRLYLLSEHTGCSEDDDGLSNTRTTLSVWPVRFLMWNLPFHAEHHLYPSIPFHKLPRTHQRLRAHLNAVGRGYVEVQRALYAALPRAER